jgi:hypothetical protein
MIRLDCTALCVFRANVALANRLLCKKVFDRLLCKKVFDRLLCKKVIFTIRNPADNVPAEKVAALPFNVTVTLDDELLGVS